MTTQEQIDQYIAAQPPPKREDLQDLNRLILGLAPACQLSFLDGRDGDGKVVTNPNIGYGAQTLAYASGETRDFYQVGVSANTTGISVYIIGLDDKTYLRETYGSRLGKATVTGYCIKFRRLSDIDLGVLGEIIGKHMARA